MDFDRFSRYELAARAVEALSPSTGLVLDVGGADGLLRERLPGYRVVAVDVAGDGFDVVCSGARLPFADGTFAVATALDVLEHVDERTRSSIVDELLRVSRRGCLIGGPFAGSDVERAEERARSFYRRFVGQDHRWLKEHEDYGLPDIDGVIEYVRSHDWSCATTSSNPLVFWERLQIANFVASRSPDTDALDRVHATLATHYLDGADADTPAYRQVIVATPYPDLLAPTIAALRPGGTGSSGWSTVDAIAALDDAIAELLGATRKERERLERQVEQQQQRIADGEQLVRDLRAELSEQESRLRLEAKLAQEKVQVAHEQRERAQETLIRDLRVQNDQLKHRIGLHQAAESHLAALLERLVREIEMLLTSRRWNIGNRIGQVIARAQRREGPPPTLHLERTISEFRQWRRGSGAAPAPTSSDGGKTINPSDGGFDWATDAKRRLDRYQKFIAEIERPPPVAPSPPSIRAVVLLPATADGVRRQIGLHRTVEGCRAAGLSVTVVGTSGCRAVGVAEVTEVTTEAVRAHLARAPEDGFLFLLPGDVPSEHLRDGIAEAVGSGAGSAAAVLVDTDILNDRGERADPRFGGCLSPDLVVETDVLGRGVVFLDADAVLPLLSRLDRDAPRDLVLRLSDAETPIRKLDRVLVHQAPDARSTEDRLDADASLARSVIARRKLASSSVVREPWGVRVEHRDPREPMISIIVPFKDRVELTRACVSSILRITTYQRYEVLLVDNRSEDSATLEFLAECSSDPRIRVLTYDRPFNYSKLNNWAAEQAAGEVLVFLNNDTRVLSPAWLDDVAGWTAQKGIGLIGGKLFLANGRIQHAGVVVGVMGYAAHAFAGEHEAVLPHPDLRHPRSWSAVTGACAAIRRETFAAVGGFDETFIVTGNDVELGLRLSRRGYRNVVVPTIVAFHLEKGSRASIPTKDVDKRRSLETYVPELEDGDPHWNQQLSRWSTAMEPRVDLHEDGYRELLARETALLKSPASPVVRSLDAGEAGFLRRYDASIADLEANAEHVRRFRSDRNVALRRVTWFVPAFDHVYRGGIYTIMRIANHLTEDFGTTNQIVVTGKGRVDLAGMRRQIKEAFPSIKVKVLHLALDGSEADLPSADLGICTLWTTAYHLLRYNQCQGKAYLVQDYEPSFYAGSAVQGLVTQTYRFGFEGIANTVGVGQAYAEYGNPTLAFTPAVDLELFYPRTHTPSVRPVRIMFYGRPSNERNGFELGLQSFVRLKEKWGDQVEIVSAGAEFDVSDYGVEGVIENLGVLRDMDAVAAEYRRSDVGVVFMFSRHPSYQPFEYMASGCATVTNHNEANSWLYVNGENALVVPPTVSAVADSISRLVEDEALRERIVRGGLETVRSMSWDRELKRVAEFLQSGRGELLHAGVEWSTDGPR